MTSEATAPPAQVEPDNPRGRAFYRKLGFREEGRLARAYKRSSEDHYVDELVMARWLGDD